MTTVEINPGICGFTTNVNATANDDEDIVLEVSCKCPSIAKMMTELGDTFDPLEECLKKPGDGAFYEYARANFPVHAACPVIAGILKCMEAEANLALKSDVSICFK